MNKQRLEILSKTKIFHNWDRARLGAMLSFIYLVTPTKNQYVFKKGELNDSIYIIVSGEVELTVPVEMTVGAKDRVHVSRMKIGVDFKNQFLREKRKRMEVSIISIGAGNYFGDEDGFLEKLKGYSARVLSNNTQLFLIPKDVSHF